MRQNSLHASSGGRERGLVSLGFHTFLTWLSHTHFRIWAPTWCLGSRPECSCSVRSSHSTAARADPCCLADTGVCCTIGTSSDFPCSTCHRSPAPVGCTHDATPALRHRRWGCRAWMASMVPIHRSPGVRIHACWIHTCPSDTSGHWSRRAFRRPMADCWRRTARWSYRRFGCTTTACTPRPWDSSQSHCRNSAGTGRPGSRSLQADARCHRECGRPRRSPDRTCRFS